MSNDGPKSAKSALCDLFISSTAWHLSLDSAMVSLNLCLDSSTVKDLYTSQSSSNVQRAKLPLECQVTFERPPGRKVRLEMQKLEKWIQSWELERYRVRTAALQDTKWFGNTACKVRGA